MTPADKLAAAEVRGRFAAEVSQPGGAINLARAALLVGEEEEPRRFDINRCLARLDEMGEEARARVRSEGGSAVAALNRYLFEEQGFAGNEADYYDPRNSMLQHVLARRAGIPITLSIVYIEVGRRVGLRVEGVGLPGHFLVRASEGEGEGVLVDPFNRKLTDREECQKRLDVIYDGRLALSEEHLRAVGVRGILARVLGNLKAVYVQAQLFRRALAAVERILLLTPHDLDERRDRGMLLAQLNRMPEAISETQGYLNLSPDAADAEVVREQLKKMHLRQAMLN
ncbi:MAG TPA: transglutaminase-like domain-containing protein [Pyrinomonadaceae bacterium]|jgi:regulator of sirC expression with transglutaminase-like and TPR domain|nr:transglutaminase-like domain-containing protein [Pyrinomonadaceae bacterium]